MRCGSSEEWRINEVQQFGSMPKRIAFVLFCAGLVSLCLSVLIFANTGVHSFSYNQFYGAIARANSGWSGFNIFSVALFWFGIVAVMVGVIGAFTQLLDWIRGG